jgi:putative FmdB family regulatory protein
MPLYDYQCPNCRTRREVLRKMSDPAPLCRDCDPKVTMEKQVTMPLPPRFRAAGYRGGGAAKSGPTPKPDYSHIPYAGPDGSIYSAAGKKLVTSDGRKV